MVNKRVLLTFPGCAGNIGFFFGVLHALRQHVDFGQLAFLTRSGSAFPVTTALCGYDVHHMFMLWIQRVRVWHVSTSNFFELKELIRAHCLTVVGETSIQEFEAPHHVQVITLPLFQRKWVSHHSTSQAYVDTILASCHIPFIFGTPWHVAVDGSRNIDGALYVPLVTSGQAVDQWVRYKHVIRIEYPEATVLGAVLGMLMYDEYVTLAHEQFAAGYQYALGPLCTQLARHGVLFSDMSYKAKRSIAEDNIMFDPNRHVFYPGPSAPPSPRKWVRCAIACNVMFRRWQIPLVWLCMTVLAKRLVGKYSGRAWWRLMKSWAYSNVHAAGRLFEIYKLLIKSIRDR
jgi:hypothetical protein